jgi:sigma-B regulation protein RsbU (phosphoserine phosphatase)
LYGDCGSNAKGRINCDITAQTFNGSQDSVHTYTTSRNICYFFSCRKSAFEKELEIGRRIQAGFLPQKIPEVEGWRVASYFKAAREVAGDFFDVFQLPDDKYLALVIGDVCDKGVGAALFMTLFRSLTRASCLYGCMQKLGNTDHQTQTVESILLNSVLTTNRYIATTHGDSSMFASMFFAILNTETGELVYVNGGHEAPLIFRTNGGLEMLSTTGPVLGLFTTANYHLQKTNLLKGDLLFAYTDGVTEAKNRREELFSEQQLLKSSNPEIKCPQAFVDDILQQIHCHCDGADQFDDITMLAVRCYGKSRSHNTARLTG